MKQFNIAKFISRLFFFLFFAFCFFVIYRQNKTEKEDFESHEWMQVEATFQSSSSYIEEATEEHVRYIWCYTYEVNGTIYTCSERGQISESPATNKRTIMVAEDDVAHYMMYENEEDFNRSYKSKNKTLFSICAAFFVILCIMTSIKIKPRRN